MSATTLLCAAVPALALFAVWAIRSTTSTTSTTTDKMGSKMTTTTDTSLPATTTAPLTRITMFKIPSPENQKKLVEAYGRLEKEAEKDGKPYILSTRAAVVGEGDEPRAKGYTVVAHQQFKSMEDMKFYDGECGAHGGVKKATKGLGVQEMPLVVYY